ncbi:MULTISPECIES: hypothetical protein [Bacteroidaceae]|jgi:hypothetical protein|uniref:hypothetical protein n=1 Tax=Bacteroidaceae TaxID=815 RepID=UPI0004687AD2|nr:MULTISPECIES: hypothetical protein [Bacteroidaceae]MCR1996953.1 hypothetical protein [Bacteroides acidifaciens]
MEKQYDMTEMQAYFSSWSSPEKTVAGIDRVIARMADWFTQLDDPATNVYFLQENINFLQALRYSIEETKPL